MVYKYIHYANEICKILNQYKDEEFKSLKCIFECSNIFEDDSSEGFTLKCTRINKPLYYFR